MPVVHDSMHKPLLLLLRSYGDFLVAISTCNPDKVTKTDVTIYASAHFQQMYDAVKSACRDTHSHLPEVQFVDFGIRHHILSAFTDRYLISLDAIAELRSVRRFLQTSAARDTPIWLEQKKRQWLFDAVTGLQTRCVHDGRINIYQAYSEFWGSRPVEQSVYATPDIRQELILPGSRLREKQLPEDLVNRLYEKAVAAGRKVVVAGLAQELDRYALPVSPVASFGQLVALIQESDNIHCADSVAAHLCELLRKPHRVYYAKAINLPWVTPHGEAIVI